MRLLAKNVMNRPSQTDPAITLRRFPWPYRAMLAFSTDIDGAAIARFRDLHRFLNTRAADTSYGAGVGLDVADSFWFYDIPNGNGSNTTYFADQEGRLVRDTAEEMIGYVKAGWIDTLHTYGNFNIGRFTPDLAERAVAVAAARNVSFPVWVDHGNKNNAQNVFHVERARSAEHVACLRALGVRFVADPLMDETFARRSVLRPAELGDGSDIWAFYRNCRLAGITDPVAFAAQFPGPLGAKLKFRTAEESSSCTVWRPPYLSAQISDARLDALVAASGFVIIGQHLNFLPNPGYKTPSFVQAFQRLAVRQRKGDILVARSSRLLRYNLALDYLRYTSAPVGDGWLIDISAIDDPVAGSFRPSQEDLAGIQFVVPSGVRVRVAVRGREVPESELLRIDIGEGRSVLGWPWHAADQADHAPASHRRSTKGSATLTDLDRSLIAFFEQQRRPDDTSEAGAQWNYSVDRALVFFNRGIGHYRNALKTAGLASGKRLLDIGFGSAHWLAAALDGYDEVRGVEVSQEYLELAGGLIEHLGLTDRMSVADAQGDILPFADSDFDRVLCHSVVHFVDPERVMAEVERVLESDGLFYCGITGAGARMFTGLSAAQGGKIAQAKGSLRILLGGAVRLSGLGNPPWSSTRAMGPDDYARIAQAYGLELVRRPDVQDVIRGVPNFPGTFDLLLTKPSSSVGRRASFARALAASALRPADFLQRMLGQAMPHLVHQAITENWVPLTPDERVILLGRSELARSPQPDSDLLKAAAAALAPGPELEIFLGLQALGEGHPAIARQHFTAAREVGDAPLLGATLDLSANIDRAYRRFRKLAEKQPDRLWTWAGLLLAALMTEKPAEIERTATLVRTRLQSGVATRL